MKPAIKLFAMAMLCCFYNTLHAQTIDNITKAADIVGSGTNGRVAFDHLGYSVAISGDIMVVGAYQQDYDESGANSVSNTGAAYVFYKDQGGTDNWGLVKKLVGSGTNGRLADDQFGWSVAISEDVIVVGANEQDYDESGGNFLDDAGAAYVFYKDQGGTDNWGLIKKLIGSGTNGRLADDQFGYSAAINGDVIVVGARDQGYDESGANQVFAAGAAYVFYKDQGGTDNWGLVKKIVGSGTNGRVAFDNFGTSVAISGDIVVIGAWLQDYNEIGFASVGNAGAAYVFYKDQGGTDNWGLVKKLVGTGTNGRIANDQFGNAVAVSDNIIVVGAPLQSYDATGGASVTNAGATYVFYKDQGGDNNWGVVKKLVGSGTNGRVNYDQFGNSVAISGDIIVVGSRSQDYDATGGASVTNAGATYVFYKDQGGSDNWGLAKKLVGSGTNGRISSDWFGHAVAVSNSIIVIGAFRQDYNESGASRVSDAGKATVFSIEYIFDSYTTSTKKLVGSGTNGRIAGDQFGNTIAVSDTVLVVGVPQQSYDESGATMLSAAGAAYIYYKNQGGADNWGLAKKIVGSGTNGRIAGDQFGKSIAIAGDIIIVGANGQDYDESGGTILNNAGAAYVFYKDQGGAGNWGLVKKLVGSGTNGRITNDQFGFSVAASGDVVAVGAIYQEFDENGANSVSDVGAAYVFYKDQGGTDNWGLVKKVVGTGTNSRGSSDEYGTSIALDENILVVGAPAQDYDASGANSLGSAGAAFVYSKDQGGSDNWGQVKKLVGSGTNGRLSGDRLGTSVTVSGTVIATGAVNQDYDGDGANGLNNSGAAYIYYQNEGGVDNWGLKKRVAGNGGASRRNFDNFGTSISLNNNTLAVGAYRQDHDADGANFISGAGAGFIFQKNQGGTDNWGQTDRIAGSGTNSRVVNDNLGISIAVGDDIIATGAYNQDYDASGANSATDAGAVYLFAKDMTCINDVWAVTPSSSTSNSAATVYSGTCAIDAGSALKSLTISSGATATIASGTVTVSESFTNNGTISGSGSITLGGTTAQSILGTGITNNVILNNSAGASITDSLKISGVYTHTAGTLTTNNKLRLVATDATTYGMIAGTGSGSISGQVIAEYFIPSTSSGKWRSISSPLTGVTIGDLSDDITINYGTPAYLNSNVWALDESQGGSSARGAWAPISSSTQTMDNNGFSIYLWDDNVSSDITMDVQGTYTDGDYTTPSLTRTGSIGDTSGWHLLRNPWPSNYTHTGTVTNLSANTIYVTEGNTFRDWNGTTGTLSNGVIPPFHAFYAEISSNSTTLTLLDANRTTSNSGNYLDKNGLINYVAVKVTNEQDIWDETRVYQDDKAENGYDNFDAKKRKNGTGAPTIYTKVEGNDISINLIKNIPANGLSFPLMFSAYESGKYTLSFTEDNIESDVEIVIEDLETKTMHKAASGEYEFTYDKDNAANQRFVLHYKRKSGTSTSVAETINQESIFVSSQNKEVHISFANEGDYTISIYDIMGREMYNGKTKTNGGTIENISLDGVAAGYYIVNVSNQNTKQTFKVFLK